MNLYYHLNSYYQSVFKERTLKIALDGGFTCPNRDGNKGIGGCIFCSSRGSGERLKKESIEKQIQDYFSSFKGKKANKYIAYFQNYTNTYKPIQELKKIYDSALNYPKIVGLAIATRCDCINEEVCQLLASYLNRYYVQVELGLQSANEMTHQSINQLISNQEFIHAVSLLNQYKIHIVIHIMVGLPNESHEDIVNTIQFLNTLHYQGLKIHSTYVLKDTVLNQLYQLGKYQPICYDDYMDELVYILTHIRPDVVIHRLTGDPDKKSLVAPEWMMHKKLILNRIEKILEVEHLYQGIYFKE